MDYEFKEYRASDVVKVDILLNGEKVDALSIIVHRTQAQYRGRAVVSKMREIISRQMLTWRSRRPSAPTSLRVRQSRRCARTCWPNATAATFPQAQAP
jgi:hypothetical protein